MREQSALDGPLLVQTKKQLYEIVCHTVVGMCGKTLSGAWFLFWKIFVYLHT